MATATRIAANGITGRNHRLHQRFSDDRKTASTATTLSSNTTLLSRHHGLDSSQIANTTAPPREIVSSKGPLTYAPKFARNPPPVAPKCAGRASLTTSL